MNAAIQDLISRTHFGTPYFNGYSDCSLQVSAVSASMCNHPVKVRGRHKYSPSHIDLYVPCRKCAQCRNTQGNDLTTRFFQDANILKHAYFVTLTYPSFRNYRDVPSALAPSFYHKDHYNSTSSAQMHEYAKLHGCSVSEAKNYVAPLYSPCLLYYPHIQQFQKILRQKLCRFYNTNVLLEFLSVGELGHKYGRPHWHILYISDYAIPQELVCQSWYYVIQSEARVDFEDLVENGTLYAHEVLGNNNGRSTKKCVKYVVKYTQKSDYKRANTTRLLFALPYLLEPSTPDYICNNQIVFLYEKEINEKLASEAKQLSKSFMPCAMSIISSSRTPIS